VEVTEVKESRIATAAGADSDFWVRELLCSKGHRLGELKAAPIVPEVMFA